jgi:hypothetical protein
VEEIKVREEASEGGEDDFEKKWRVEISCERGRQIVASRKYKKKIESQVGQDVTLTYQPCPCTQEPTLASLIRHLRSQPLSALRVRVDWSTLVVLAFSTEKVYE